MPGMDSHPKKLMLRFPEGPGLLPAAALIGALHLIVVAAAAVV